jgi:5-methylcytosine-specific restriction protein A
MVLRREPLCRECRKLDILTPATDIDHVTPRSAGGSDEVDNLQALCHSCHSRKTARERGE